MKKILIAVLAALLVVCMAAVAMAAEAGTSGTTRIIYDSTGKGIIVQFDEDGYGTVIGSVTGATTTDFDYSKEKTENGKHYVWDNYSESWVELGTGTKTYGKNWAGEVVVKATCVSKGLKKYVNLDNPSEIKYEEIDMLKEHTFDMKASTTYVWTKAGCTYDGGYVAVCTVCKGVYGWSAAAGAPVCLQAGKLANVPEADYDNVSAATPRGTKVLKIAKRNHKWSVGTIITAPTCQENGKVRYTCQNIDQTLEYDPCGITTEEVLSKDETVFDNRIQKTDKRYHNWIEVVEAPIGKDGIGFHYYRCKTCGAVTDNMPFTANTVRYNGNYDSKKAGDVPATANTTTPAKTTTTTSSGSKTSSSSTNKKGVSIPKTNDTTSNLPYVLIAVAFVGLVALVASKKKVNG